MNPEKAIIRITADDYYKLYINGAFVAMEPAPSYHFNYNYNEIDVSAYLSEGENLIAVHTLYQGLVNRVWQSGDLRHGLWLELFADEKQFLVSDEGFKCAVHSAYGEMGTVGYETGFLEEYASRLPHVGFVLFDYDDSNWENACICKFDDHVLVKQKTESVVTKKISPAEMRRNGNTVLVDFASNYVGYLCVSVKGKSGEKISLRCGQELSEDGSVRYNLRASCVNAEDWMLSDGVSILDWFDYKSFRYAELDLPYGCEIEEIYLIARHYPFSLKEEYRSDEHIK